MLWWLICLSNMEKFEILIHHMCVNFDVHLQHPVRATLIFCYVMNVYFYLLGIIQLQFEVILQGNKLYWHYHFISWVLTEIQSLESISILCICSSCLFILTWVDEQI